MEKLYSRIAELLIAMDNCDKSNNHEWFDKHQESIEELIDRFMPSGSGWDNGTKLDYETSHGNKLVFFGSFHHMNDGGYYDGWTDHSIVVTPHLAYEFSMRVNGRNRNDIKSYLHDLFYEALNTDISEYIESERRVIRIKNRIAKYYFAARKRYNEAWINYPSSLGRSGNTAINAYREAKIRATWYEFECSDNNQPKLGSVRLRDSGDLEDLKGDCYNRAGCGEHMSQRTMEQQEKEFEDRAERDGVWGIIGEYWDGSKWINVDSCWGFVGDDWKDSGTDLDIMQSTLDAAADARKEINCNHCGKRHAGECIL